MDTQTVISQAKTIYQKYGKGQVSWQTGVAQLIGLGYDKSTSHQILLGTYHLPG